MKNKGSRALSHKGQGAALKRDDSEMTLKIRPAGSFFSYSSNIWNLMTLVSTYFLYTIFIPLSPSLSPILYRL